MHEHIVLDSAHQERCSICRESAKHKVSEVLPRPKGYLRDHPFTNYLCCEHFGTVMGPLARKVCGEAAPANNSLNSDVGNRPSETDTGDSSVAHAG